MAIDPETSAAIDQDRANLFEYLPPLVWGLYQLYRAQGFEHDQAMRLVSDCQTAVIQMPTEIVPGAETVDDEEDDDDNGEVP